MNLPIPRPPRPLSLALGCLLLNTGIALAEPAPDTAERELPAVEVKGQTLRGAAASYSTTVFDSQDIQPLHVSQAQELFRHVPGMNVQNYQLSGVADTLVLRGFGGGGHGGDLGVVLDGIPLNEAMSHADGYVDFNVIVPLEIDRLTVFKGPVSALYGNFNRAGLVAVETRKRDAYRELDLSLGSHRSLDAQAALGLPLQDGGQLNLAAQHDRSDGFRAQSRAERSTLAGRWSRALTPDLEIALSGRLHEAEGDSPSYLTAAQFAADPYGKDPRAMNDGATKHFATLRADLNYALTPDIRLLSFAYGTRQDFTRWFSRPVSPAAWRQREETYDRTVFGAGTSLNGRTQTRWSALNWVAGVETFRESTAYQYDDGLDQRMRLSPAIDDRTSRLDSLSAFAEVDAPIHALFQPSLGLRWDRFSGGCSLDGAETGSDPCGPLARLSHASPKLGVRSDVAPGVRLRASWAEGFALPNTFAKYALGASQLDPNVFRQTEVGAQFKPAQGLLLDIAAYRLRSSDEIRTVAPGVYENYGATLRRGVEASALWSIRPDLDVSLVYGSARSRITENASAALLGKSVAGVPRYTATAAISWTPVAAWTGTLTWRRVGAYAVTADNSVNYAGYATVDLGVSYVPPAASRYRLYATVANVGDKAYATSAAVIGGTQVFAPGAPRSLKVGAQLQF
ncbi:MULTISPECIES: TonB-dependent receptor [unclassified Variovorax]|uniref:TonB-dependent receptor n=1 Tax=unclassified Variovorax TaxID=663243 RepID=UPI002574EAAF|nr:MULTISPECIES: TonB-dependent receptor [unclassified Variovorax]MDM0087065.1 TonB-dependent receptor [Variovorax sp. J22G40]MDM0144678.1 TonB-dependent receptor [Variovorax sp. J2P1-31]